MPFSRFLLWCLLMPGIASLVHAGPKSQKAPVRGRVAPTDPVLIEIKEPASAAADIDSLYTVSEEGTLKMPLLDSVIHVVGIPYTELPAKIEAAYRQAGVFENVRIVAKLHDPSSCIPPEVSVGGEVQGGGKQIELKNRKSISLEAAILAAGGFTAEADRQHVKVIHQNKVRNFDLSAGSKKKENNPLIVDGDTVVVPGVPELKEKRRLAVEAEIIQRQEAQKAEDARKREAHRFQPDDLFRVQVTGTGDTPASIDTIAVLPADGTLSLPGFEKPVPAGGSSLPDLEKRIREAAGKAGFQAPVVTISLWQEDHKPYPFVTVSGEIKGGARRVSFPGNLRPLEAIRNAGDFTETANRQTVKLIRGGIEEVMNLESPERPAFYQPRLQAGDRIEVGRK